MKPIFIHIENFMGHESSDIDFTSFEAALIIGRLDGNENKSNAVGKSTIFRAIEFCIFNECARGIKLEKIIRDDQQKCKVIFDFECDGVIYRITRSRTRKGSADLSLFKRSAVVDDTLNPHVATLSNEDFKKLWSPITGRRASDTEEELQKIHKMNHKAFCNSYYFAQDDFENGLARATAGARKDILKSSLQLAIYTALNKLASTKASVFMKEIDRKKTELAIIGDPDADILNLETKLQEATLNITDQEIKINSTNAELGNINQYFSDLKDKYKILFAQLESLLKRHKDAVAKVKKAEVIASDYKVKRKNVADAGKSLASDLKLLKTKKDDLSQIDFSELAVFKEQLELGKKFVAEKSGLISSLKEDLIDLSIPLPDQGFCKHCRQPLTDTHRRECEKSTNEEIEKKKLKIVDLMKEINDLRQSNMILSEKIQNLEMAKKQLDRVTVDFSSKEKEFSDKKALFNEYEGFYNKSITELNEANLEFESIDREMKNSSSNELEDLQKLIATQEQLLIQVQRRLSEENSFLSKIISQKAVVEHSIAEKKKLSAHKIIYKKELEEFEALYADMPDVIESFGPTGIPNLIIQDILDDLQLEANSILEQIRPGLQLTFAIEKVRGDGQLDDDLGINYFLNGRPRDYGLLSGAQKLCVMVSLKLGLAYLLRKKVGATMQMLLLDEVDQSLDKASIDAFADIIKFFQKDFTILVITHNDRLKDKFNHVIMVEQDQNLVSKTKVVSSW